MFTKLPQLAAVVLAVAALGLAAYAARSLAGGGQVTLSGAGADVATDDGTPGARWGPAMLTFVLRGREVWGTTGARSQPRCLLGPWRPGSPEDMNSLQWSKDGTMLVYEATREILETAPSIFQAEYSSPYDVRGPSECVCPIGVLPRLSPDGSRLACIHSETADHSVMGDPRLVVVPTRPGGPQGEIKDLSPLIERFINPVFWAAETTDAEWSPSGRQLVASMFRIVVIDLDRMTAKELDCGTIPRNTRWSPDGRRLAFSWSPLMEDSPDGHPVDPCPATEISAVNRDGTGLANLTNDPREDKRPSWSPDGRLIAFLRREHEVEDDDEPEAKPPSTRLLLGEPLPPHYSYEIWVMNADGTEQRQLTDEVATDDEPLWSPDGRWIAYSSEGWPNERARLWVVGLDDSPPQEVAADLQGILGCIAWRPAIEPSPEARE